MLECVLCLCSCARLCVQIFDSFLICNMSGNWQRIVAISRNFIRFPFFMLLFNLRMYAQLLKILFDNSLPYHYLSSASNHERKTIRFLFKTTLFWGNEKTQNTTHNFQLFYIKMRCQNDNVNMVVRKRALLSSMPLLSLSTTLHSYQFHSILLAKENANFISLNLFAVVIRGQFSMGNKWFKSKFQIKNNLKSQR